MVVSVVLADNSMRFDENPSGNAMLEMLRRQRSSGRFCDVVLRVSSGLSRPMQDKRFAAHRSVLAACSDYFSSVLKRDRITKEQINIGCHDVDVFETLLDYMYSGNITIDWHNVNELLKLCHYFLMSKVTTYCNQFLEQYLSVDNCIAVRDLAQKYSLNDLVLICSEFISDNLTEVIEQPFMCEMSTKKLESVIKDPTIGFKNFPVSQLLMFLITWTKKDVQRRSADFDHLLTFIDWHKMKLEFIFDHIDTEVLYRENTQCLYYTLKCLHKNNINIDRYSDQYKELNQLFAKKRGLITGADVDEELIVPDIDQSDDLNSSPIVVQPIDSSDSNTKSKTKVQNQKQGSVKQSKKILQNKKKAMNRKKCENYKSIETQDLGLRNSKRNIKEKYPKNEWFVNKSEMKKRTNSSDNNESIKVTNNKNQRKKSIDKELENNNNLDELMEDELDEEEEFKSDSSNVEDFNENSEISPKRRPKREIKNSSSTLAHWKDGVKCPHCIYVGHSATRLEQHLSRVHEEDTTYRCKMCPYVCKWNREYYKHMKSHFGVPPYKCEDCDYSCDRIQFILSHRMRHTDERPFHCELCPFKSRTKGNLIVHMRIHTGEKPYKCHHCERSFAMKNTLDQHLATHREERPFLCDSCGFTTKYQSHLLSHKRIHTGNVFHCEQTGCTYSSPRRSQLAAHMRSHLSIRSHICSTCGRAFIEKSHLIRHERIHLDEKPFKCELCDYGSTRRDKLKEHILKHHSVQQSPKNTNKPRKSRRQIAQSFSYITESNDNSIASQSQVAIVGSPQEIQISQSQLSEQELCTATASLIYEYSSGEVTVSPARVVIQSAIPSVTYDSVDHSVAERLNTNNSDSPTRVVIQSIPSTTYVSNSQTDPNSTQTTITNSTEMGGLSAFMALF